MEMTMRRISVLAIIACCTLLSVTFTRATAYDPAAINIQLPDQIPWKSQSGELSGDIEVATLVGDPSKPGLYVQLIKRTPHSNSRPHFDDNDRFITVLSGTWWVGTGRSYQPDKMVPVPAGGFITHYAHRVYYDGAKEESVIIQVVGIGPVTAAIMEDVPGRGVGRPAITPLEVYPKPQQ